MLRIWVSSRKPTMTSAGDAASNGTTDTSGVKNMATTKSPPVTTLASPVRAPSPTPRRGLDVGGVGRRRRGAAGDRGQRVDQQDTLRPRQLSLLVEQPRLRPDADDRAHRVEEVGQHQREDEEQRRNHA